MNKKYFIYKIINKINEKVYIGCHITENVNDGYMGSGTNIKKAINEFGRENFDKIILHNFNNKEDMLEKEKELVNKDFVKKDNNYNIIIGGGKLVTLDLIVVSDGNGEYFTTHKDDPRYLSGELNGVMKGKIVVRDNNNNIIVIDKNDPRYISGELVGYSKGKINVKNTNGNIFQIDKNDPRYLSGELVGLFSTKDKDGNIFQIDKSDPRYLSGELVSLWKGKTHTEETKLKMSKAKKGKYIGEKSTWYGMCWVTKSGENKRIKKEELDTYIINGWRKGRDYSKIKVNASSRKGTSMGEENSQYGTKWITNGTDNKKIKKEELNTYINNGWRKGRTNGNKKKL